MEQYELEKGPLWGVGLCAHERQAEVFRQDDWEAMIMLRFFHKSAPPSPAGPVEYLVVGLGNPGREYEGTRHNAGFCTVDFIAAQCGGRIDRLKFKALCGDVSLGGKRVLLMKPQTYMNLSGQSVREAMSFYKIPSERTIIIFDDISLPPGRLRIRRKGSDGGHNGIKNIIYLTGRDDFPRIKMGVGAKPHPEYDLAAWVLSRFTESEQKELAAAVEHAAAAAALMVQGKIDEAMSRYNS
jgi:PTH1 family peptidyl-tRNA hydrolase